jgi:hypothetical protein
LLLFSAAIAVHKTGVEQVNFRGVFQESGLLNGYLVEALCHRNSIHDEQNRLAVGGVVKGFLDSLFWGALLSK